MSRTRYLLHYRTDVVENRGQSGPLIHPSITPRLWMNERGAGCDRDRMGTIASSERVGSLRMLCSQSTASRRLRISECIAVVIVAPIEACKVLLDDDCE